MTKREGGLARRVFSGKRKETRDRNSFQDVYPASLIRISQSILFYF